MNFVPGLLHLCDSLFLLKSKLVARKQGRCAEKASAGKEFQPEIPPVFPQNEAGLSAPGGVPLQWNDSIFEERIDCPPGLRSEARLMIFSRNALASGPGNP